MEWIVYEKPEEFAKKAVPFLQQHEDSLSLMQGVLHAIQGGTYEEFFLAAVEEDGRPLALLLMTPPHPLNVVLIEESRAGTVLDTIVQGLTAHDVRPTGIIGRKHHVKPLAGKWAAVTGQSIREAMDQGIYRLDEVVSGLSASPGQFRYAEEADSPLIEDWFAAFEKDCGLPPSSADTIREKTARFIGKREVFLWEDGGRIVSVMKKARPTVHGVTVSFVYTPEEERRKGYGRTMVTAGSAELLKDYDFCILYTDMANPTSNKIYQEIGYRFIADSVHLVFE
ncbi:MULTISPECIES: GNAT family N-acetyltransferase [Sporosarcina]|uniref:GNAT family N-acetyltransferase n=1 Tax=Sporosarcina TaxID=1569 RepID=UPI00058F2D3F|nr:MULTISPECIES: GNAT family N-acetyltransferase [Sporosarcina]WJY28309.1 GNAT family N-acetyltransferase [Sporosarcina sp. 0.2-SM1T-5]